MLKKKIILVAACVVLIAAAVVVVNAFVKKNPESVAESVAEDVTAQQEAETKVADKHAGQVQSVISGKWESAEDGANVPVAVMYSNIEQAMPQSNISKADVVFESLVEGGITRLCCLFENQTDLEKIGPVRSCRTYYLLFAKEFEAIYVHFGYSEYAADYLAQSSFHALDGMYKCSFYRTEDRVAPHNAYTSWDGIMYSAISSGYDTTYKSDFVKPFTFNEDETKEVEISNGDVCNAFYPGYPYNKPWFEYNAETKEYLRFQFGGEQIDAETGEQLSYKNILVKYVEPDYYENGTPNYKIDGTGTGLYITNGKAVEVTWKKDSETQGPTKYYYADGTEVVLNQGKTYICQIETSQNVTIEGDYE
jgi:hypothetical protein